MNKMRGMWYVKGAVSKTTTMSTLDPDLRFMQLAESFGAMSELSVEELFRRGIEFHKMAISAKKQGRVLAVGLSEDEELIIQIQSIIQV